MTKPIIRIHNLESNQIIDREMTDAEFAKWTAEKEEADRAQTLLENKVEARKALLAKLGITEEEAKILLS